MQLFSLSHVSKFNASVTIFALSIITTPSFPVMAAAQEVCVMPPTGEVVCGKPVAKPRSNPKPTGGNRTLSDSRDGRFNVRWTLNSCERKSSDVSCSFTLITTKERIEYALRLEPHNTKMTDRRGREYYVRKITFVDKEGTPQSNGWIGREMQKGSTYDVSIDFADFPSSVTEVNSLIVAAGWSSYIPIKFDNVSIQ
jgi:hypothetical protein